MSVPGFDVRGGTVEGENANGFERIGEAIGSIGGS